MRLIKSLCTFVLLVSSLVYADNSYLKDGLRSEKGILLEVHAVVADQSMLVLTLRSPNNFFSFEHYSAYGLNESVHDELLKLKRHDRIMVKGELADNRSKQGHIEVSAFTMNYDFQNPYNPRDYDYADRAQELPAELKTKNSAEFLVHAIHASGEILVLEYKDRVVPVFVRPDQAHLTRDLARNDMVRVHYEVSRYPVAPTHIRLSTTHAEPVEVLESALAMHGKTADVTGELILFPKSPQVLFDVFAIGENLENGLRRQYTLINFENFELFQKILEKCGDAWKTNPTDFENGRNKLIHKTIRFRARGVFNATDANQANVQILINDIEDLEWVQD